MKNFAKTSLKILYKTLACIIGVLILAILVTGFSPIYKFRAPAPFSGPDIFNPYAGLDTVQGWKRAVFHVHTRVKGPLPYNECEFWPDETYAALEKLGYDIVTFSNHNEITTHPFDTALQVNVYEQGYSPFKFHKLVFGSDRVIHYDPLLPLLASQKQFQLDYLGRSADFIQINHPYRTVGMSKSHMEALSGYEIMELDTGVSTENEYWDWALSAGHYSFGLANDDLHYPDRSWCIGVRCNFVCCPSGRYEDIKNTLLGGCYYAMRVPDYGGGDWEEKYARNRCLPSVKDIGLRDSTIFIRLSAPAEYIRVIGTDHATLLEVRDSDCLEYAMQPGDAYARLTAVFPDGEAIYSNPFARYDASVADSPFDETPQRINWFLTILYNLLLAAAVAACVPALLKILTRQ